MNPFKKVFLVSAYALLAVGNMAAQRRTTSAPTPAAQQLRHVQGIPESVILKNVDAAGEVKRLPVLHAYALGDLRRQSVLRFGDRQIDMKPYLNNPHAVANVAAKLQAAPQYVKVLNTTSTASEVEQGVVIETDLQFSFANGACVNSGSRAAIDNLGVHCPVRASAPGKGANQLDAMVPMSHLSSNAVSVNRAKYATYYKQQDSLIQQHIASLRAALKDPNKHAQMVAAVGQAKVDQISAFTDDQLKDNIASVGVHHIHETIFVPKAATTKISDKILALGAKPSKPGIAAPVQSQDQTTDQPLGPDIYLTGFTLGNSYEWQVTFSFEIDPCMLGLDVLSDGLASVVSSIFGVSGCPMHASITPYAYLDIGFGMRFPIKTTMQYHRQVTGKKTTANVRVGFEPFDGSAVDYAKAGLQQGQIFNGQEFVAEIKTGAGIGYDMPVLGSDKLGINLDLDLTQYLPAPFTGGNFAPPAPGHVLNSAPIDLAQVDLFGNLFDLATLQATLNPAIEVGVTSGGLSFDLVDKMNKTKQEPTGHLVHLTQPATVPLATDPKDHSTDFLLTNPNYNIGFLVTPGVVVNVAVDLAVWSQSWTAPIWFPQLAIELPPNGINFSCHDGTICTHEYQQNGGQANVGTVTAADVIKQIKAQGCDGPGSDNQFYCRSYQAWDNCITHVSQTPYKGCGLDSADQLLSILKSLDCPNGYCNTVNNVMTPFGCPAGMSQCTHETNVAACKRIITDPGMQKWGYTNCCMNPSKFPASKGCVALTAPPPAPRVDTPKNATANPPTGPPTQTQPKTTTPTTGGTTPPTPHVGQSPTHEPNHPPATTTTIPAKPAASTTPPAKTVTPAATKPAASTPPPTASTTPAAAAKKTGTTATTKPGTTPQK